MLSQQSLRGGQHYKLMAISNVFCFKSFVHVKRLATGRFSCDLIKLCNTLFFNRSIKE